MLSAFRRNFNLTVRKLSSEIKPNPKDSIKTDKHDNNVEIPQDMKEQFIEMRIFYEKLAFAEKEQEKIRKNQKDLIKKFEQIKKNHEKISNSVKTLRAQSKVLKVAAPLAQQIYETAQECQKLFIQEFLPEIYSKLPEENQNFSYLKEQSDERIGDFFKRPIITKFDQFLQSENFEVIVEFQKFKTLKHIKDSDL